MGTRKSFPHISTLHYCFPASSTLCRLNSRYQTHGRMANSLFNWSARRCSPVLLSVRRLVLTDITLLKIFWKHIEKVSDSESMQFMLKCDEITDENVSTKPTFLYWRRLRDRNDRRILKFGQRTIEAKFIAIMLYNISHRIPRNLAIANRSRVSSAHKVATVFFFNGVCFTGRKYVEHQ